MSNKTDKDLSEDKKMDYKKENWCDKCHVKDDCEDKETFFGVRRRNLCRVCIIRT